MESNEKKEEGTKMELGKEFLEAAGRGDAERVKGLLQKGVDVNYSEMLDEYSRPYTAFRMAAEAGHEDVVRVFLEKDHDDHLDVQGAFCAAAYEGHAAVVKLLLERGVDPSANNNEVFRRVCLKGQYDVAKLLLQDVRVDPAAQYNFAVYFAATYGETDVVRLLLADERVDAKAAIPRCDPRSLGVFLEDERVGVHVNRGIFEKYHADDLDRFDELIEERTARIVAVSWAMKQIGQGWGDLREPTEERMQKLPLDWLTKMSEYE